MLLDIVLPCYNEEAVLPETNRRLMGKLGVDLIPNHADFWLLQRDIKICGRKEFDGEKGVWMVYPGKEAGLPETPADLAACERIFSTSGIKGYLCP